MALAVVCGGGSLVLFGAWPLDLVHLGMTDVATLLWDGLLSIAFFLQHSVMVRTSVRRWQRRFLPERYFGAVYAIASGVVLTLVLVLWQHSPTVVFSIRGPLRWIAHALAAASLAGFVWGVVSLRPFDLFGLEPIKAHLHGTPPRASQFTVRGAYRWVRHPLYAAVLLLIWAQPDVTADRLLFQVLWTSWIVVATVLEERDLVAEFGDPYLMYRRSVPMLIPWHAPRT